MTSAAIQSPQNPQLKHLAKLLGHAKHRREHGQAVLEGAHLLTAYLDAGNTPLQVYLPEHRLHEPEIAALLCRLPADIVQPVSGKALGKITQLHQAEDLMTLIALPPPATPESPDYVLLDRVQDAGNVGTVLRSAAAAGIRQIVLGEGCADAYSPKVLRAGMGAHFLLHIQERVCLTEWCARYPHAVYATALDGNRPALLYQLDLRAPCAWIFGNEGSGVSPELIALAGRSVKIPMQGATESLNIAQAATVCLFEQMRQRWQQQP